MAVERQVGAVDGKIAVESGFLTFPVVAADERDRRAPKEPVMADEEVHAGGDGGLEGLLPGVDGSADLADLAVVGHLKSVVGSVEILDFAAAGALVAELDEIGEGGHGRKLVPTGPRREG